MDAEARGVRGRAGEAPALGSPIESYLADLFARISGDRRGEVATYNPELAKADPDWFAIALATVDGEVYGVGDRAQDFTIQSVSKPFMYGYALREYGRDFVLDHVGVEPTGEAFNAIVLDEANNRPFNPMVNAGAMAVAELMKGDSGEARRQSLLALFAQFAGRPLEIDQAVFRSEHATGHRNRAIAYMMLNSGMITRDPADVLNLYFEQCSIKVTCRDLAVMAATLANDGINPLTGEPVLSPGDVRDVLTVMHSCGMYNYAGQWAYEVGMPAKSGVSGGIIAVIPGQIGIGVFAPRLDQHGNSIRGVRVCQEISDHFGLHIFNNRTNTRSLIRREYRGDAVNSNRLRTPREREILEREASTIAVLELQGALYFGSVERLVRRARALAGGEVTRLVLDFKRVHLADTAAITLLRELTRSLAGHGCGVAFVNVGTDRLLLELRQEAEGLVEAGEIALFDDIDLALESFENELLSRHLRLEDRTKFGLASLDVFKGLTPAECGLLEAIVRPMQFEKGDLIVRRGDEANVFFAVARGTASVFISVQDGRRKRVACIGPGLTFGEMALLDGGRRSADVVADETVVCYGLSVEALRELARQHPNIMITILSNLIRDFSERLRRANGEIQALA